MKLYREFRKDGWPLCPQCGEDELYSLCVPATAETITGCYRCSWTPPAPEPISCFICHSPGLAGTTPLTIQRTAGLGWERFEARMGVAIFGYSNLDDEGFERAQYNPFHEEFHDNFVQGDGRTQDEAIEALQEDHRQMHEGLFA